ncbi:MAG: Fur family transcriptional regulator [Bacteroidota bacterium]|nr:Fur family transcriptional regulator [Bacteroidota bacterium]
MDYNSSIEILKKYIKENNLRSTPERERILKEVIKLDDHFNAEQLYNHLKKKDDKIVLATVYNTLDLFVSTGILTKYRLGAEHSYYEKVIDKPGHHHLICLECGSIVEFVAEILSNYEIKIAKQNNFKIHNSTHQIFGICEECQQKK